MVVAPAPISPPTALMQRILELETVVRRLLDPPLQFNCCVVDGDDVGMRGEESSRRLPFSPDRLLTAVTELHKRGYTNVIVFTTHESDVKSHSKFFDLDSDRLLWMTSLTYTIHDVVECALRYRCPFITNFDDVAGLETAWRVPCSVREWLVKYRSALHVNFAWTNYGHFGVHRSQQVEKLATSILSNGSDVIISDWASLTQCPLGSFDLPNAQPTPPVQPLASGVGSVTSPAKMTGAGQGALPTNDGALGPDIAASEVRPLAKNAPPPPPPHPPAHARTQAGVAPAASAQPQTTWASPAYPTASLGQPPHQPSATILAETEDYCLKLVEYSGRLLVCFYLEREAVSTGLAPFASEVASNVLGEARLDEDEDTEIPNLTTEVTSQLVTVMTGKWSGTKAIGLGSNSKCRKRAGKIAVSVAALAQTEKKRTVLHQDLACDAVLHNLVACVRESLTGKTLSLAGTDLSQKAPERGRSLSRAPPDGASSSAAPPPPPPGRPPENCIVPRPPQPLGMDAEIRQPTQHHSSGNASTDTHQVSKSTVSAWLDSGGEAAADDDAGNGYQKQVCADMPSCPPQQAPLPPDDSKRMRFESLRAPPRTSGPGCIMTSPDVPAVQQAPCAADARNHMPFEEHLCNGARLPLRNDDIFNQLVRVVKTHEAENDGYLNLREGEAIRIQCYRPELGDSHQDQYSYYVYGKLESSSIAAGEPRQGWFPYDSAVVRFD